MVSNIEAVKNQSLSKVIDVFSMLLLRTIVVFGTDSSFLRIGFNYFTEIGLKYLLTIKDLIKPSKKLVTRADTFENKKFSDILEALSSLEAKDKYPQRIQTIIDYSRKYMGREINTKNIQRSALEQMVNRLKRYQVKVLQQPEIKEAERILNLLLDMTESFLRRTDLVDYVREFKSPSFMKAVQDDPAYVKAEKEFFSTIKNFGMAYRTFFMFKNYYMTMIKKFQHQIKITGIPDRTKPDYTKSNLEMLGWLTGFVNTITSVLEKVEWYLSPELI